MSIENTAESKEVDPNVAFEAATDMLMRNIQAMSHLIETGWVTMTPEKWKKFDALRDELFHLKTHATTL